MHDCVSVTAVFAAAKRCKMGQQYTTGLSQQNLANFFNIKKTFLPLDEVAVSRVVFVIVSVSDGWAEKLLEPAK